MPNRGSKKLSLSTVITKVRRIADVQYDGKVYDSIMPIFNQLSASEKRVLLRGLIGICFTIEEKVNDTLYTPESESEVEVDSFQKDDETAMKPWKFKVVGALLLSLLVFITASSFFLTGDNGLIIRAVRFIEVVKKGLTS